MEFGFVGPAYEAANSTQDNQRLINWYVETDNNGQTPGSVGAEAKVATALLGVPGLIALSTAFTGPCRGAWVLPGNTQALFVIGSRVVLVNVTTPATALANPVLSFADVGGLITSTGPIKIRDNGAGGIAALVDGVNLYIYNIANQTVTRSTDGAFTGSNTVIELDGIFVWHQPGSQKFYCSPLYWNGISPIDATYYALKDNASDNVVAVFENARQLWIMGESTIEPWYNAGNPTFPFSRLSGGMIQLGCGAAQSIARGGPEIVMLARSERGENSVIMLKGYQYETISTFAISYALTQYTVVSDAIGYVYAEEGHMFYVLIFPTADATWVYDFSTGVWHQRASFDPLTGLFHRQRINNLVNFAGMRIGGDFVNGRIYQQTRKAYADDQYPLVALRRAPHVWDKNDRNRVNHARLQVDMTPGSGLATGQGQNPQAMLRWSNDQGRTFGNEHWAPIGAMGNSLTRVMWRRMGSSRDRVYEMRISDPVKRDVAGASLRVEITGQ